MMSLRRLKTGDARFFLMASSDDLTSRMSSSTWRMVTSSFADDLTSFDDSSGVMTSRNSPTDRRDLKRRRRQSGTKHHRLVHVKYPDSVHMHVLQQSNALLVCPGVQRMFNSVKGRLPTLRTARTGGSDDWESSLFSDER